MGIILAILLFSAIIIIHELGHFLLAKANGIRMNFHWDLDQRCSESSLVRQSSA